VLSAAPVPAQDGRPQTPDLTGTWRLNTELSDRAPSDRPLLPDPQGARGRGGRGGPRGSGGYDAAPRRRDLERMEAIRRPAFDVPVRMTIVRAEDAYIITTEDGQGTRLVPDGKKAKSTVGNIDVETTALWEGAQLVVTRKLDGGITVIHQYSRFDNPRQLIVITRIERDRSDVQPPAMTRVYEPID